MGWWELTVGSPQLGGVETDLGFVRDVFVSLVLADTPNRSF